MSYRESDETDVNREVRPFPSEGIGCFKDRLKKVIGSRSVREFSRECGLSDATLRSYLDGNTYPTLDRLELIAKAAGMSPLELAYGVGTTPDVGNDQDAYAFIPLYDARCSAGHGAWNERAKVLTHLAFTRYSLRKKGLKPDDLACLRNDGDSMVGLIADDDTVMIDLGRDSLEGEGVYVILLDDHLYAKRLQRQFDGTIHIISENKAYNLMVVPKDQTESLQIIGRVVWAGGWLI